MHDLHLLSAINVTRRQRVRFSTQPFFSIVTPVFNGVNYLNEYVLTLKSQTFSNWEAIVVDDGSSDGTWDLLNQLVGDDTRFKLYENDLERVIRGPYQARNKALSLATGCYICFLDIDDLWHPQKLELQAFEVERQPNIVFLYSSYYRSDGDHALMRVPSIFVPLKFWIYILNPIPMLTACIKRDLVANNKFRAEFHEDYLFWYAVTRGIRQQDIHINNMPLAYYRLSTISLSSNKIKAVLWIFKCYRGFGRSFLSASALICVRGALHCIEFSIMRLHAMMALRNFDWKKYCKKNVMASLHTSSYQSVRWPRRSRHSKNSANETTEF